MSAYIKEAKHVPAVGARYQHSVSHPLSQSRLEIDCFLVSRTCCYGLLRKKIDVRDTNNKAWGKRAPRGQAVVRSVI